MSVSVSGDGVILLEGHCTIEDAEILVRHFSDNPAAAVDCSRCAKVHTAVIQVLMAAKPRMVGFPTEPFLRENLSALTPLR